MKKEIPIKYFIPAQALEHPHNSEFFILSEKIKWAVIRYYLFNDFFSLSLIEDPPPALSIHGFTLNKTDLGYDVWGYIKSG